jgi:hypothetical protein
LEGDGLCALSACRPVRTKEERVFEEEMTERFQTVQWWQKELLPNKACDIRELTKTELATLLRIVLERKEWLWLRIGKRSTDNQKSAI